jgi:hypothetical protein
MTYKVSGRARTMLEKTSTTPPMRTALIDIFFIRPDSFSGNGEAIST